MSKGKRLNGVKLFEDAIYSAPMPCMVVIYREVLTE